MKDIARREPTVGEISLAVYSGITIPKDHFEKILIELIGAAISVLPRPVGNDETILRYMGDIGYHAITVRDRIMKTLNPDTTPPSSSAPPQN